MGINHLPLKRQRACSVEIAAAIVLTLLLNVPWIQLASADLDGSNVQENVGLVNSQVSIQFAHEPEEPVIDDFTKLRFSVQDQVTGEHLHNVFARVVIATPGGERLFVFDNINVTAGHFKIEYNFPDDGTHVVLVRIYSDELLALTSFSVFVPHQSAPSLLDPFPQNDDSTEVVASKVLLIAAPIFAIVAIVLVIKRTKPSVGK